MESQAAEEQMLSITSEEALEVLEEFFSKPGPHEQVEPDVGFLCADSESVAEAAADVMDDESGAADAASVGEHLQPSESSNSLVVAIATYQALTSGRQPAAVGETSTPPSGRLHALYRAILRFEEENASRVEGRWITANCEIDKGVLDVMFRLLGCAYFRGKMTRTEFTEKRVLLWTFKTAMHTLRNGGVYTSLNRFEKNVNAMSRRFVKSGGNHACACCRRRCN